MASENGSESDISISFPLPPPPQPHFYCFPPPPPPPPQFFCFPSPPPLPPHFYCFLSFACSFHFFFLHDILYKDCQLPSLVHFVAISRVVNNNSGFLQLLADCPAHQRQFLLKTASLQQLHALVLEDSRTAKCGQYEVLDVEMAVFIMTTFVQKISYFVLRKRWLNRYGVTVSVLRFFRRHGLSLATCRLLSLHNRTTPDVQID